MIAVLDMPYRWIVAGALLVLPQVAFAQRKELAPAATTAAEIDDVLYSCKRHPGPVTVTLKPETEVKDLVTWVMGFTCKSFVLDPRIVATGRKVNLVVPTELTASEAYDVFLIALSTAGLAVVPRGRVMRVVEAATAKKEALPIYKQVPGDSDRFVRVVVRPTYAQPEALKQAFLAIKSDAGDITAVGALLVITDYASAISGMMALKQLVDVRSGAEGIYTIPIRHGDATKVLSILTAMLGAPASAAPASAPRPGGEVAAATSAPAPSKIVADERTNTLVLSASEAAYQRAKALVDRLDVTIDLEAGATLHTYQLSSAIAEEVAQTLTKAISGDAGATRSTRPAASGPAAAGTAPASPAAAPAAIPAASGDALVGLGSALQGAVHVIADKATNKLLITSSAHDFLALRDVIRELDQPRRQVYIEAMILEIDVSNGSSMGASSHAGTSTSAGGLTFGGVQLPQLSSINPSSALTAGGLIAGVLGSQLAASTSLLGTTIPSYGVLLQALATRSYTNVLSTPSIIALDNEEAKSKIGENIPYLSATVPAVAGTTTTTAVSTSVARQPLELELDIKPHISADNSVLLEIKHSNGGVKDQSGTLGPTWTTREVETRVVVRDQQTVVIGGLMQDSEIDSVSQVPLLGDIPVLGYLFKYTTKTKHKTNLLIMLTPYIIRDHSDLEQIQARKLRENQEFYRGMASLEGMRFQPEVDYRRKRGLIEEINVAIREVEAEAAARAAIAPPAGVVPGAVDEPVTPPPAPGPQ